MSSTIFEQVKEAAGSEKRSLSWYRRQVKLIAKNYTLDLLKSDENYDSSATPDFQDSNELQTHMACCLEIVCLHSAIFEENTLILCRSC